VKRWLAAVSVIAVVGLRPVAAQGPRVAVSPPLEFVQIDGAKNPELIPQWSAWGYAFRLIAGGRRELPALVHEAVSGDERAMVLNEADAVQRTDKVCQERVSQLHPLVGKEKAAVLDARLREITVTCRQKTLDARNRVLSAMGPEGAIALIMFVESTKSGTSLSIAKRDLARFLEPE
jgi:hypothetical protein